MGGRPFDSESPLLPPPHHEASLPWWGIWVQLPEHCDIHIAIRADIQGRAPVLSRATGVGHPAAGMAVHVTARSCREQNIGSARDFPHGSSLSEARKSLHGPHPLTRHGCLCHEQYHQKVGTGGFWERSHQEETRLDLS